VSRAAQNPRLPSAAARAGKGDRDRGVPNGSALKPVLGAAPALAIQGGAGNRAVARLLAAGPAVLRRACTCGRHCQRRGAPCAGCAGREVEELLRKPDPQATGPRAGDVLSPELRRYLAASRGGGRPLEAEVRHGLERSFGRPLDSVRVHTGPAAAGAARSLGARAFALGKEIWFGAGEYRPDRPEGRYLLAHEVAHTVEQRATPALARVRVGGPTDPAEGRADRAAEAAARGLNVSDPGPELGGESSAVVRRFTIVRAGVVDEGGERVAEVDLDDGTRYRVRRDCQMIRYEGIGPGRFRPPTATAGADRENIFVQISWCQGTRGRVRGGADVPEQFQAAIRRLVQGALAGRNPDDVLRETTLTPFIDFAIAESGGLSVEGRVQVTVGGDGVQAARGSILFRHGPFDFGVTGRGGGESGTEVMVTLSYTPGRASARFECPRSRRRVEQFRRECMFECTRETVDRPAPPPPEPLTRTDREEATIYFQYASSAPNPELTGPELDRLRGLFREGYRVDTIHGFASPEGPLEQQRRGGFQGNRRLSAERGERARAEIEALCGELGVEPGCGVADGPAVVGCGERFGGAPECDGPQEGQPRTERQGRDVAREAVRQFRADPAEMARLTTRDRERLDRATSDEERAGILYPYLRRASLTLVRVVELPPPPPRFQLPELRPLICPEPIMERARPLLERERAPGPRR
jgi:hypothetical protein